MVKYVIFLLFSIHGLTSQSDFIENSIDVQVGDVFEIGNSEYIMYKYLKFPSANTIIKSGGITSFKSVEGTKVLVTSINKDKEGATQVEIEQADGRHFFNRSKSVGVSFHEAIHSGELIKCE